MITSLRIKNFKSWKDTGEMQFAPITGFFGANSSGKTSILQMLLLLKQSAETPGRQRALIFAGPYVYLESFAGILHKDKNGQQARDLEWEVGWELPFRLPFSLASQTGRGRFTASNLSLTSRLSQSSRSLQFENSHPLEQILVSEFAYEFEDDKTGRRFQVGMRRIDDRGQKYVVFDRGGALLASDQDQTVDIRPEKSYGFPYRLTTELPGINGELLPWFAVSVERLFERVYYLGPLRASPKSEYVWSGSAPSGVGSAGEYAIDAILSSRSNDQTAGIGNDRQKLNVEEHVAKWLRKLGLIHEFALRDLDDSGQRVRVEVRRSPSSPSVLMTEVGFGVSQILPVLVLCFSVPKGSTVIIEQPEAHLHPKAQTELGDLLIEVARKRKLGLIIESHSEHLLTRLQRRIAEGPLPTNDVALYFCHTKNGSSALTPLKITDFGSIENWPEDFFGDEFGERAAMMDAEMRKRIESAAA